MPDITMCSGIDCPYKDSCYRYTAKPSEYQSYFVDPPIKNDKCDSYWGDNAESIWSQLEDIMEQDNTCTLCNGSGEGMWDGSTCSSCKGLGVKIK
jgi:DnaJ-class molecular chaperone